MNPIKPPIKADDRGDAVANLQAAFLFLLDRDVTLFFDPLETPAPDQLKVIKEALLVEAAAMLFDKTTRALTAAFQRRQGLTAQVRGAVDQTAADALNDRLRQHGALDDDRTFAVKGHVLRTGTSEPQPGVQVGVFAVDATGETGLGASQTNASGIYRVEFPASLVKAAPGAAAGKVIVVRAYRPDGTQMGAAAWDGPINALTVLDVVVEFDEFVVRGRITDTRARPKPGLKVVAFDRDLRFPQRLNDAQTDADGRYAISYRTEQFRRAEGGAPQAADVFITVLPDVGQEPLAVSETRYRAKPVEIIDLEVPALDKESSEFERVTSVVTPLLEGQGQPRVVHHVVADPIPTDLQPHEVNAEDIESLVLKTALEAAAIQAWTESARWQQQALRLLGADAQPNDVAALNGHGWPFFFAWIRANQFAGLMGVLRSESQVWSSVQSSAEALNRIPPVNEENWKLLVNALRELARLAAVEETLNSGDPLVEILRLAPD